MTPPSPTSLSESPGKGVGGLGRFALVLLFALAAGTARAQNAAPATPAQTKAALDRILSRPEFQPESAQSSAFERVLHWFGEEWDKLMKWLKSLLPHFGGGVSLGGGGWLQWVFIALFILLGAWLIALLVRRAVQDYGSRDRAAASKAYTQEEFEAETVSEPDAWIAQARKYADNADYRRAFRAVFLAVIWQMDRAGAVQFERSKTNGDYARTLRAARRQALYDLFAPFSARFDARWYGAVPADEEDYRTGLTAYQRILDALKSSEANPATAGRS